MIIGNPAISAPRCRVLGFRQKKALLSVAVDFSRCGGLSLCSNPRTGIPRLWLSLLAPSQCQRSSLGNLLPYISILGHKFWPDVWFFCITWFLRGSFLQLWLYNLCHFQLIFCDSCSTCIFWLFAEVSSMILQSWSPSIFNCKTLKFECPLFFFFRLTAINYLGYQKRIL